MVALLVFASAAYSLITTIQPFVDIQTFSIPALPKLPMIWAVVITLGAISFVAVEGGYRLQQEQYEKVRQEHDALIARQSALQIFVRQPVFRFLPPFETWLPARFWFKLRFRNDSPTNQTSVVINGFTVRGFGNCGVGGIHIYKEGFGGTELADIIHIGAGLTEEAFVMADVLIPYHSDSPPTGNLTGVLFLEGGHGGALAPIEFTARMVEGVPAAPQTSG